MKKKKLYIFAPKAVIIVGVAHLRAGGVFIEVFLVGVDPLASASACLIEAFAVAESKSVGVNEQPILGV